MAKILVVDDELSMREFLELMLTREGYEVQVAAGGAEALARAAETNFDMVISDIRMKPVDGIDVLKGVKAIKPEVVVILISAFATPETAVLAMKEGAYDFIPKPFQVGELKAVIRGAVSHGNPEIEKQVLEKQVQQGRHFGNLVGLSPEMLKVYDIIRRAAQTSTNIIITGESGTGKELVAKAIHDYSPRAKESFVAINCGAMPEQLIESELFGHRKGAFTGAHIDKPGLFELAHKGTIFLDEVAELSLHMQVKLLRVVQDRTYRAVGGTQEKQLDVRFIAATNKNLESELMAGNFREDLYYRLNVINVHMPPLRDRQGDIPLLAQYFLQKYSEIMGKDVRKISSYALDILSRYSFPGNVRELENIIERSVALEQSNIILPESLTLASFKQQRRLAQEIPDDQTETMQAPEPKTAPTLQKEKSLDDVLGDLEKSLLIQALQDTEGVRHKAAELLGISSWRLRTRLSRHRLSHLDLGHLKEQAHITQIPDTVPDDLVPSWQAGGLTLDQVLLKAEKHLIRKALLEAGGSKTMAADILGITRRTLHHRLSRTGLVNEA